MESVNEKGGKRNGVYTWRYSGVSLVNLQVFHGIPVGHTDCALPKGLFCRLTSRHTVEAHGDRNSAGC